MLMIEHPAATCPGCGTPLLYGTKEEATGWKAFYLCGDRCGFERMTGRIPMANIDHMDEVGERAEEMGTRWA